MIASIEEPDVPTGDRGAPARIKPAAESPRLWQRALPLLKPHFGSVWGWVKTAFASGTGLLFILIGCIGVRHLQSESIILTPVTLPASLSQTDISARELTQRLADEIDSINQAARSAEGERTFALESEAAVPKVEVPGVGIQLEQLLELVSRAFGWSHPRAVWEVTARPRTALSTTARPDGPRDQQWLITAHLSGNRAHSVSFDPSNPDAAVAAVARAIVGDVAPLVVVRALLFNEDCEGARARANIYLRRLRDSLEIARMYNMLGLAAECPFNDEHAGLTDAPDWGEAERYYLAALELDPLAVLPAINLARMRIQRGAGDSVSSELTGDSLASVLAVFDSASKRAPRLAEVEEAWGYSLMNTDDFAGAIRHLEIARKLDQTSVSVYRRLTRAYLTTGDTSKAIEMFSLGLARNGNDVDMLTEYGHVLLNRRDYSGARRAFARALRQDTSEVGTRFYLAESLRGESPEAAVRVFCSVQRRTKRGDEYRFRTDSALATLANGEPCQKEARARPRVSGDQRARAAS